MIFLWHFYVSAIFLLSCAVVTWTFFQFLEHTTGLLTQSLCICCPFCLKYYFLHIIWLRPTHPSGLCSSDISIGKPSLTFQDEISLFHVLMVTCSVPAYGVLVSIYNSFIGLHNTYLLIICYFPGSVPSDKDIVANKTVPPPQRSSFSNGEGGIDDNRINK